MAKKWQNKFWSLKMLHKQSSDIKIISPNMANIIILHIFLLKKLNFDKTVPN